MPDDENRRMRPTPATLSAARLFLLERWRERHAEIDPDGPPPTDLSGSCKFTSQFAAKVFGGRVEGNPFHQWVRLEDGTPIDLNEGSDDVATLMRGEIPEYMAAHARATMATLPRKPYRHDSRHMRRADTKRSNRSCAQRVDAWVKRFLSEANGR